MRRARPPGTGGGGAAGGPGGFGGGGGGGGGGHRRSGLRWRPWGPWWGSSVPPPHSPWHGGTELIFSPQVEGREWDSSVPAPGTELGPLAHNSPTSPCQYPKGHPVRR